MSNSTCYRKRYKTPIMSEPSDREKRFANRLMLLNVKLEGSGISIQRNVLPGNMDLMLVGRNFFLFCFVLVKQVAIRVRIIDLAQLFLLIQQIALPFGG